MRTVSFREVQSVTTRMLYAKFLVFFGLFRARKSITDRCSCDIQEVPTPAASTPASHAPTPVSTSYAHKDKGDSSAAPTPTSTTASKAGKKKGKAGSARPVPEDSETDARETKKTRINFGAGRK